MKFRRGANAIIDTISTTSAQTKYVPTIQFEPNSVKYLQFFTPLEDVITVLMHQWVIVDKREDGSPVYESFISRKDPALDGPNGYDELWDRFGLVPKHRSIALAAELDVNMSNKTAEVAHRVYERDGEEIKVPCFGLVIQSPHIFFAHLVNYNDLKPIEESIFAIKRTGSGMDTTYTFIDTGIAPLDLRETYENFSKIFDFDAWLEELSSEERMRQYISNLPDNWSISKFPVRKRTKESNSDRASSENSVASTNTKEPLEVSRSKKFEELRKKVLQEQ